MILVAYVYLLISSGSWNHPPDWSYAIQSLEHLGVGGVAVLVLVGFGLGLAIHPLQFAVVQFFEGYWGVSRPALRMRSERIMRYQRQFREIDERGMKASDVLAHWEDIAEVAPDRRHSVLFSRFPFGTRATKPHVSLPIIALKVTNPSCRPGSATCSEVLS